MTENPSDETLAKYCLDEIELETPKRKLQIICKMIEIVLKEIIA